MVQGVFREMMDSYSELTPDFTTVRHCPLCGAGEIKDCLDLPFCGSEVERYIFKYYNINDEISREEYARLFSGQRYIIARCERCGASFQRNRPGRNISTLVYDHWISSASSGRSAASRLGLYDVQHHMSEAVKLISLAMKSTGESEFPRLHAMDYGMGNGFFALALKACLIDVSGTEFSDDRLNFGRENGIKTFHIDADLPKNHFHIINTEQVMEHVPNPRDTIAKLVSSLKSGGILKISVPHSVSIERGDLMIDWNASRYARHSPMPIAPLEHLQYFSRTCREVIAQDYGLEIIKMPFYYHIVYASNWTIRGTMRNFGRAVFLSKMRNYFILRKK